MGWFGATYRAHKMFCEGITMRSHALRVFLRQHCTTLALELALRSCSTNDWHQYTYNVVKANGISCTFSEFRLALQIVSLDESRWTKFLTPERI